MTPSEAPPFRVGTGFDVHRFEEGGRGLVLGGQSLDHPRLAGHSDGDAIAHAVADALLGAAGLGDLGTRYPASDASLAGADSMGLLAEVVANVVEAGWAPANVDCAVVAERPALAPHRAAMERRLSEVVGAPVTVKPKRGEGLGALGRGEGVAVWAVALLWRPDPA